MFEEATRFAVDTGKGYSTTSALNAVDKAMIDASVGHLNVLEVSSILPEGIEKVEEYSEETGSFRPAVVSRATGSDEDVAAGLAWGFNRHGSGYVMERSKEGEDIDMDKFRTGLEERLLAMADARENELKKVEMATEKITVSEDEFGSVIAVLVYLP